MLKRSASQSLITFALALLVTAASAICQDVRSNVQSPEEVIAKYRELDSKGLRLSKTGRRSAAPLFLKPRPQVGRGEITVIAAERITPAKISGDKAEVWAVSEDIGSIDASGRFSSSLVRSADNAKAVSPEIHGPAPIAHVYELVFTGQYWILKQDGELQAVNGSKQWKIVAFEPDSRLTIQATIKYLTQMSSKTTDAVLKRNAQKSIVELKKIAPQKF